MRVVVIGQPKTGNVWVKHLLASLYGLQILPHEPGGTVVALQDFAERGQFPDNAIFHQHYWPQDEVLGLAARHGWQLVTPLRNPYDTFVSLYFHVQARRDQIVGSGDPNEMLIGKPFEHPDVLKFLETHFGDHLALSLAWVRSGRSIPVRYEDLYFTPYRATRRVAAQLAPVGMLRTIRSIRASRASTLKQRGNDYAIHIRTATVADWQHHLCQAHLEVFRRKHADLVCALGYEVHERTAGPVIPLGERRRETLSSAGKVPARTVTSQS